MDKISCEGNFFVITDEDNYSEMYLVEDVKKLFNFSITYVSVIMKNFIVNFIYFFFFLSSKQNW